MEITIYKCFLFAYNQFTQLLNPFWVVPTIE